SGLDTDSIIESLMEIERQPVVLLEQKQYKLDYEKQALNEVNNSLLSLKTCIKSFADGLAFENVFASQDESVATGSADASATQGSYELSVTRLAQRQVVASSDLATGWTVPGTGEFTITHAGTGEVFTITLSGGETLTQVAQAINSSIGDDGNQFYGTMGVAQVLTDPVNGTKTLVIKTDETGAENGLSFADTVNSPMEDLGITSGGVLNELQAAENAELYIDGIQIESSSNTVTDALTGVTFILHGETDPGEKITVSIGLNEDDIISRISDFIEQFNTTTDLIADYLSEDVVDDPETVDELQYGVLRGDSDLASAKSEIRMKTTGYIDSSLSVFQILSQIGITSESSSGSIVSDNIELDEEKLRAALSQDKDAVESLLEGWAEELDDYLEAQTKVSVAQTMAGNFYRRILNIDERIDNIDDDIADWEERLADMEERMRTEYSNMETVLAELQTQNEYLTAQLDSLKSAS
ncbi:MAG: flagellar filament capping protein FliD, partial [Candidatus Latescibacterota bacterium]